MSYKGPGSLIARLIALSEFTEKKCGHNPVSARRFETTLIAKFNEMEARLYRIRELAQRMEHQRACKLLPCNCGLDEILAIAGDQKLTAAGKEKESL